MSSVNVKLFVFYFCIKRIQTARSDVGMITRRIRKKGKSPGVINFITANWFRVTSQGTKNQSGAINHKKNAVNKFNKLLIRSPLELISIIRL